MRNEVLWRAGANEAISRNRTDPTDSTDQMAHCQHQPFLRRSCQLAMIALILLVAGCGEKGPPLPPLEALAKIAGRIDEIVAQNKTVSEPAAPPAKQEIPKDANQIDFWFYSHPLLGKLAGANSETVQAFAAAHPQTRFTAHYIGDWNVAVQKLTVSLAVDDLPDIALVSRTWLPRLILSGRIAPLDTLLPPEFVADLRAPSKNEFMKDGHLWALPADGFCSVLYYNADLIGDAVPSNWAGLKELAMRISKPSDDPRNGLYAIGDVPFIEMLWSAGVDASDAAPAVGLHSPAAKEVVEFMLFLRDGKVAYPRALGNPEFAFNLFLNGKVAMTVGSSEWLPQAMKAPFKAGVAPIPGKDGAISRLSDSAIVVFAKYAEPKRAGIAAVLDFLTGPLVQGADAIEKGSAPIRDARTDSPRHGLEQAYAAARNTPLVPEWPEIEYELNHFIGHIYPWIGWRVD